jgi:hypothetical protein
MKIKPQRHGDTENIMIHVFSAVIVYYNKELTGRIIEKSFNICH